MNIEKAFITEGTSVFDFSQKPGVGFYIPLYQRQYSWDKDNVEQLLDDISKGIETLIEDDNELRFLGTIITVVENNPNNIQPLDRSGLPPSVQFVIDGQQRLSTIALFSCILYKKLAEIEKKLPKKDKEAYDDLSEAIISWKDKLFNVFSFDLRRGKPRRKPKIIRGSQDKWVKTGTIKSNYRSTVAKYLAEFIDFSDTGIVPNYRKIKEETQVTKNLKQIEKWLNKILNAHNNDEEDFPPAWEIVGKDKIKENYIWGYEREYLMGIIQKREINNKKSVEYLTCSLVQLFAVCHYLLDRCCFTSIQPVDDKWAFDMFQSLNATGTPLTAIETFKPLVVNITQEKEEDFRASTNQTAFKKVELLFKDVKTANRKSKLTNDFLASFTTSFAGRATSSHFSDQRKWLGNTYNGLNKNDTQEGYNLQCKFIDYMGIYATFYKKVWIDYTGDNNKSINFLNLHNDGELASLIILFLKDSNHKMAITFLSQFYEKILMEETNAKDDFIEICKTIAAFYIMWRSARSNAGLDNIYRHFFRGFESKDGSIKVNSHTWQQRLLHGLSVQEVKDYLISVLNREKIEIGTKANWVDKAKSFLSYKQSKICRFLLLIAFHDTIPDTEQGLIKLGKDGSAKYLTIEKWNSKDLKSLEHIAPQTKKGYWDISLYEKELIDTIGNLTLLPQEINSSAGNKSWKEKKIYYQHINEKDPTQIMLLANQAKKEGIALRESTIELLRNVNYHRHMESLLNIDNFNADLVDKRTVRILNIVWDKIYKWLF